MELTHRHFIEQAQKAHERLIYTWKEANMRVLVTGGTGHIAKTTINRLLEKGWQVRSIDLAETSDVAGVEYIRCDILDYPALLELAKGCDAVVHLAALRSPSFTNGPKTFEVNAAGTYNVFEAAAVNGIKRVVQASSINALGAYFSTGDMRLQYLPVDEEHPSHTTDPYSFSKQLVEEIGRYYWRREGISSVALRFPGVYKSETFSAEPFRERLAKMRQVLDELLALPETDRAAKMADAEQRMLAFRRERPMEYRGDKPPVTRPATPDDLLFAMVMANRFDLWAMLDERDAAQAIEKSLTSHYEGSHPLFINGSQNVLGYNSQALIKLFYPHITRFTAPLDGAATLVSIEKARQLIGYEPEFEVPPITTS
ncbi:MAG: NAD(P)-dependent oxidoreductase [Chloroflexi bacterium]|nr:NAD(P)-dependent oxidoreductase [Chloroflexota bacterium]MCC6891625.1 NAD(P)-dependent oxidoreductase [Anaerolineae bacterium]